MTEVMMEKERSEATLAVPDEFDAVDEQLVEQLTDRARSQGLELTGEGGLLARLTKRVVDSALEGELDDHLGYAKHDAGGRDGGNPRNGTRAKTGADRGRPGESGRAPRPGRQFQPAAGQEAAATAVRARRAGDLAVGCRGRHSHTGVSPH